MKKLILLLFLLTASAVCVQAQPPTKEIIKVTSDITGASTCVVGKLYYQDTTGKNWERINGVCTRIDGTNSGAPTDATYITQTPSTGLSAEQAMSALATGLVKNTTTTGVQSIVVPGTGVETFITTPTAANLATVLSTGITGTAGKVVFDTQPTLDLPITKSYAIQPAVVAGAEYLDSTAHHFYKGKDDGSAWLQMLLSSDIIATSQGGLGADESAASGVPLFAAGVVTMTATSGTGSIVRATSPAIVTPTIAKLANLVSNGFVKTSGGDGTLGVDTNTYLTGNQTVTLSGDVSGSGATAITTTIGANKVTNAMLAQVATATFKGRTTALTGDIEDLTATQATALLNVMVGDAGAGGTKGLVPAPAAGDATKVLSGAGTWIANGGGSGTVGSASAGQVAVYSAATTVGGDPDLTFLTDTLTATKLKSANLIVPSDATNAFQIFASNGTTPKVQVSDAASDSTKFVVINEFNIIGSPQERGIISQENADFAHSAHISARRSRGTAASPTTLQVDDYILGLVNLPYGSAYTESGYIASKVNAVSANNFSTEWIFAVAKTGTTVEVANIDPDGNFALGTGNTPAPVFNAVSAPRQYIKTQAATSASEGFQIVNSSNTLMVSVRNDGNLCVFSHTDPAACDSRITAKQDGGAAIATLINTSNDVDANLHFDITGSSVTDKRAIIGPTTNTAITLQTNGTERMRITGGGQLTFPGTLTAAGTTGAQTINKTFFSVNFAAAATSLVVTNSYVTTSTPCICTIQTNDTTMTSVQAVPAAGSVTLFSNAAATAETKVACLVLAAN